MRNHINPLDQHRVDIELDIDIEKSTQLFFFFASLQYLLHFNPPIQPKTPFQLGRMEASKSQLHGAIGFRHPAN
jgi:hypothetical protein